MPGAPAPDFSAPTDGNVAEVWRKVKATGRVDTVIAAAEAQS